jgi:GT2 family glycosyltransferase
VDQVHSPIEVDSLNEVQHIPAHDRAEAPLCSICIANYNGAELLDDCISSLRMQQTDIAFEIIVHDDASTDGSVTLLRSKYPEVELLIGSRNVGFCISNNRMVSIARGRYVLLLNNDAALNPDALDSFSEAAGRCETPSVLTLPQYDWYTGDLVDRGCLLDPFYNPVPNLDSSRTELAYVIGACLWIPIDLWNEIGGFPEWLESIAEDMYLCCAARLRGARVAALTTSGYRHRQGASFGGNGVVNGKLKSSFRRRYFSERNKLAVMVVCTPTWLMWPLLFLTVVALLFESLALTCIKLDWKIWKKIYWPAFKWVLFHRTLLHRNRLEQQAKRKLPLRHYLQSFVSRPRKLKMLRRYGLPKFHG